MNEHQLALPVARNLEHRQALKCIYLYKSATPHRYRFGLGVRLVVAALLSMLLISSASLAAGAGQVDPGTTEGVIIDTDFGLPPFDDSFAVALVLNSSKARVLGISTVAGNQALDVENVELQVFVERMDRLEIPLYSGAQLPLNIETHPSATSLRERFQVGRAAFRAQSDGRAKFQSESAASFIARSVVAAPHQITILALGPLTNIAMALRQDPRVATLVKKIVIMGGYFPADSGVDLHTAPIPNAEFNFWIDPDAARIVIDSGAAIEISPIDVSKTVPFTEAMRHQLASGRGPFSAMVKDFMPQTDTDKNGVAGYTYFYDGLAAAGIVAPEVRTTAKYYVDIDSNPGVDYGASVRHSVEKGPIPGGHASGTVDVQTKIDIQAFYKLVTDRLAK